MAKLLTIAIVFTTNILFAQSRILIDDDFSDWDFISTSVFDNIGDGGSSGIDFGRVKFSNDENYLFIYVEVGKEINLQDENEITVYIDTDNDPNSGQNKNGIGADLVYTFGDRNGTSYISGFADLIFHNDIGMVSASTVSNNKFEIAIRRNVLLSGKPTIPSDIIKVIIEDETFNGDRVPNGTNFLTYTFSYDQLPPLPPYQIQNSTQSDFRVLSYNVLRDDLFAVSKTDEYDRILNAIQPDIIGFQEIYDHTAEEVADRVASFIGGEWYFAQQGPDNHAISKYPIIGSFFIPGYNSSAGNGGFLIDLPDHEEHLLLVVAHTPCCNNDSGRQAEVDAIMGFIRDAKNGTGLLQLEPNSPIVIVGDMNLVGDAQQLQTFLDGNIINTAKYGPKFRPDWDESNFIDGKPYATGLPLATTWYDEGSSFSPGRLDFMIYSGSVLEEVNSYSLFTPSLPQDTLSAYNLNSDDAVIASDHLPLVTDFKLKIIANNEIVEFENQWTIYPNPSQNMLYLKVDNFSILPHTTNVYDLLGHLIHSYPIEELDQIDPQTYVLDCSNIPDGFYTFQLKGNKKTTNKKVYIQK